MYSSQISEHPQNPNRKKTNKKKAAITTFRLCDSLKKKNSLQQHKRYTIGHLLLVVDFFQVRFVKKVLTFVVDCFLTLFLLSLNPKFCTN